MTAAARIEALLSPLLNGFVLSFGKLHGAPVATQRYAVLKPAGGSNGDLVRRPLFTLDLLGRQGGDALEMAGITETVITNLRNNAGGLVYLAPGEPSFTTSAEGRPIFTVAIAALANHDSP